MNVFRRSLPPVVAVAFTAFLFGCPPSQNQQPQQVAGQYPQQPYPQQPGYPQQPYPQQPGYPQQPPPQQYPQQPGYPQQPQPQYPQPGQPAPVPGQPAPAPGQPAPAPGQPAAPGLPFPIPGFPGAAPASGGGTGGSATLIDPNLAQAATIPLMAFANSEAPGMQKEGAMIAANFQQGQTLEHEMTIQPGKCYTVVSVGAGIQEVDITMVAVTPIPGQSPQLGRDTTSGAQASLGGRGNCIKLALSPFPIQAKYIITATRGAGIAAAQLYVK